MLTQNDVAGLKKMISRLQPEEWKQRYGHVLPAALDTIEEQQRRIHNLIVHGACYGTNDYFAAIESLRECLK